MESKRKEIAVPYVALSLFVCLALHPGAPLA